MSDAPVKKRVALTTIGDVVRKSPFGGAGGGSADEGFFPKGFASQAGSSGAGSGGSGSGKPAKSANRQTIRLELELFEPNAKSFPEFNYSKLVHEAQVSGNRWGGLKGGDVKARGNHQPRGASMVIRKKNS